MILYINQQQGKLGFDISLIDSNAGTSSFCGTFFAKNGEAFVETVAQYAAQYKVERIVTNNIAYVNQKIENKINSTLTQNYGITKFVKMEYKN